MIFLHADLRLLAQVEVALAQQQQQDAAHGADVEGRAPAEPIGRNHLGRFTGADGRPEDIET